MPIYRSMAAEVGLRYGSAPRQHAHGKGIPKTNKPRAVFWDPGKPDQTLISRFPHLIVLLGSLQAEKIMAQFITALFSKANV